MCSCLTSCRASPASKGPSSIGSGPHCTGANRRGANRIPANAGCGGAIAVGAAREAFGGGEYHRQCFRCGACKAAAADRMASSPRDAASSFSPSVFLDARRGETSFLGGRRAERSPARVEEG